MKKLFLITGLAITLFACSIFKPMQADNGAKTQLNAIQTNVNTMYSNPNFNQDEYTLIDNEITDLITYDITRANLTAIVNNVKALQTLFSSIELRHKAKGILNPTLQGYYKQTITDKITDIFTAENKLK